jgi:hypothetical protein
MERQILLEDGRDLPVRGDVSCYVDVEARIAGRTGDGKSVRQKKPRDVYVEKQSL